MHYVVIEPHRSEYLRPIRSAKGVGNRPALRGRARLVTGGKTSATGLRYAAREHLLRAQDARVIHCQVAQRQRVHVLCGP